MPRIYTCSFCGRPIQPGRMRMYIKTDGTIYRFCSSKCFKSMIKLRRDPRKLKWTAKYGQAVR
ncbi:MAG: 50S ribosomal protein L24 [Thermoprotei archaeon]|nr:MAG: 50S ribosomal protein L24 [Thermoprotei archaeon]RLF19529.1 MAG: 50S ribosomal protein L24 [Thermoprotei archaeon]